MKIICSTFATPYFTSLLFSRDNFAARKIEVLLDIRSAPLFTAKNPWRGSLYLFCPHQSAAYFRRAFGNHVLNCAIMHALFFTAAWRRTVTRGTKEIRGHYREQFALPLVSALSNFYLPADSPFKPKSIGACSDLISIPKREPCLSPSSREDPLAPHT